VPEKSLLLKRKNTNVNQQGLRLAQINVHNLTSVDKTQNNQD